MSQNLDQAFSVVIGGVGGQGALTIAQLVLGAAWKADYFTIQSEVHGMSQRGGAVNAQVIFDSRPVTSPVVTQGGGDLLIGLEPLEAMRYLGMIKKDGAIFVSKSPIKNMDTYPDESELFAKLSSVENVKLVDTALFAKQLGYSQAGNMILLGLASTKMPFELSLWEDVIAERFKHKGEKIISNNMKAFTLGRNLEV
ncbi:MAG: 2-oxoacid:acceptor oxidoreductase family protein [Bacteriovoracaceae bacterium]|nr:2-oxoacid:acceptor oxidoreductase family protein [Bacteriovoracaceae bacterium]